MCLSLDFIIMSKRKSSCKLGGCTLSAKFRASEPEFRDDFYHDGDKLFCRFCQHTVDWQRRNTLIDHQKSVKHKKNKDIAERKIPATGHTGPAKKQRTLFSTAASTSMEERSTFQRDFVRMMTYADIPLEKVTKMKPFLKKHCAQGGALTTPNNLRETHLPRVFEEHYACLKEKLAGQYVSVIVDETTDCRDKSVLNVVVGHLECLYLVDVVFMEKCDAQTLSQTVLKTLTNVGIDYNNVCCFVTDNAAYCKAAFRILTNILPNAIHVGCMAHILNLVGEDLIKDDYFHEVEVFANDIKNIFKRQPARHRRYLEHLKESKIEPVNLPPEPVQTRWGTYFCAIEYHAKHLAAYESFFAKEQSEAQNVNRVRKALADRKDSLQLKMNFIAESSAKIKNTLTKLEGNQPFAPVLFQTISDMGAYLSAGTQKSKFGTETDRCVDQLDEEGKKDSVAHFNKGFELASKKLKKHVENSQAMGFYKLCQIFDPRTIGTVAHELEKYSDIPSLKNPSHELQEEWNVYISAALSGNLSPDLDLNAYWKSMIYRTPKLAKIALDLIWLRTTSVDCERSFSQYNSLLTDRRERLSEEHTKQLLMLKFNGDIEGRMT